MKSVLANPHPQTLELLGIKDNEMNHTILLVEDHQDSRELMIDMLEFSGYKVISAGDGLEGERLAKEKCPALILLDISLPHKNGLEVAQSLRESESTQSIPIIALTAHARPEDESNAREAGCNSYLAKPVKPKDVIQEIKRFLG